MPQEASAGKIQVADIEELNYSVWPWDLRMHQLSRGELRADLDFAQVNGILLTHERWSRRICATGATPRGYVALASSSTEKTFSCTGREIGSGNVICEIDGADIEFSTPDNDEHWVILVPIGQIVGLLGEELVAALLRTRHADSGDPRLIRHLGALVVRVVATLREHSSYRTNALLLNAIESQLLGAIAELLVSTSRCAEHETPRKRFLACRRALRYAEKLKRPVSVDELARVAGVSRRSLELGFRETLDISPQRYLRYLRLNGLHRDLRRASPGKGTVTQAAMHWGFVELGRTAVEYRELFGETPSTTLTRSGRLDCWRLADALAFTSSVKRSDHVHDDRRSY